MFEVLAAIRQSGRDALAGIAILALAAGFLAPFLVNGEKLFFDDIAYVFYPQQVFLSRCLPRGIIPWWNPHTFAGAVPYYAGWQSALYPLNWPFLALGHLASPGDYFWLIKAPFLLHYLMAAGFAFLFARWGLRLSRWGAVVLAGSYTLSPTIVYMSYYPPTLFVQSWLPLYCCLAVGYSRRGRISWLIGGSLAFAVGSTGGDLPFVFHVALIFGLFSLGLAVSALLRRDRARAFRFLLAPAVFIILGILLSGVYWANALAGVRMIVSQDAKSIRLLSGPGESLTPWYLVTLAIPDFFGGVTSKHAWGAAYQFSCTLNDVQLLGGVGVLFLALLGGAILIRARSRPPNADPPLRSLWWIFLGLFVISLITVLGPRTPAGRLLPRLLPVFRMPYPVRFRSLECFAVSGLLGVSVTALGDRGRRTIRTAAGIYLVFVAGAVIAALLQPYPDLEGKTRPGYELLSDAGEWGHFQASSLIYAAGAGSIILFTAWVLRVRARAAALSALVLSECFLCAFAGLYRSQVLNYRVADISAMRYRDPEEHPLYRLARRWRMPPALSAWYRKAYFRSYLDPIAWFDQSFSILGFDAKPMDPRFREALSSLVDGFPYELWIRGWSSQFWPNMSVRYYLTSDVLSLPRLQSTGRVGQYLSYESLAAVPRLYYQDQWSTGRDPQQLDALLNLDLRSQGWCDEETWSLRPPDLASPAGQPIKPDWMERFANLQRQNKIVSWDFSDPNRVELTVSAARPAMLVMTDLWHPGWTAAIDNRAAPLRRVNYLQRGLWCPPGRHAVVLNFRPPSLNPGLLMTGAGMLGLVSGLIAAGRQRSARRTARG